jgi:hypothetical protein
MGLCFRIYGLIDGPQIIRFWNENCLALEKIQVHLAYFKEDMLDSLEFQRIKKSTTCSVFTTMSLIFLHVLIVHGYRLYRTLTDETGYWDKDSDFHVGSGFWSIFVLVHVINSIWISFFIRIYSASFLCVAKKIEELEKNYSFIFYSRELFKVEKGQGHDLNRCLEAFNLVEKLVERFNELFGQKLVAEMLIIITNLVIHSFFMTLWIGRNNWRQVAMIFVPFAVFVTHIYRLGTVGGELTLAARKVNAAIVRIVPEIGDLSPEMKFKVQMLTIRMHCVPPVVTGRHFFEVNRRLVTSVNTFMEIK